MQKQVAVPLALLFLPIATAVDFLLDCYSQFCLLQSGPVLSPSQPALVHFCLTHQRLFARLWLLGMGCSLLNAAMTTFYFLRLKDFAVLNPYRLRFITPLFVAVVISLPLSFAAVWLGNHTSAFNPPVLSQGGGTIPVPATSLLPTALLIVSVGVILVLCVSATFLIFSVALWCANELVSHLRRPEPPPVPSSQL